MSTKTRTASAAIAARNRANAQHSTGPRSAAGKAASSRNAVKHGLLGTQRLALPGEDQAALDAYRDDYVAELGATGIVQTDLAERASFLVWRLGRLARYKRGLLTPADSCPASLSGTVPSPALDPAYRAALQADLDDATYTLERLHSWGRLPADQPLAPRSATALLSLYASTLDPWEEVLPLLPDAQPGQSPADYCAAPLRTAGEWRDIYKDLVLRSGVTWQAMSWAAMETANDEVARLTALLAPPPPPPPAPPPPAPALLPDLDTLERLMRYETALSRELSRALRELRQLQSAEHAIEYQTNPSVATAVAAAVSAPAVAATISLPLPCRNDETNPAGPGPNHQVAETNPPAVPTQPAAAAGRCHDTAVSGPGAAVARCRATAVAGSPQPETLRAARHRQRRSKRAAHRRP